MNFVAFAYILWIISALLQLFGTVLPYWKTNDPSNQLIELREVYIGLWHKCTGYSTGIFSCDDFDSLWLGQHSEVTTARALMGVTMLLDLIVFCCFQVAAPWVGCTGGDAKRKILTAAATCMLFANICTTAGSGFYGSKVLNDYLTMEGLLNRDRGFRGGGLDIGSAAGTDTMKFGGSLYACWISVLFGFSGAIMMFCCMKHELDFDDEDEYYDPNVGSMAHNPNVTGAPPSGVGPTYNRQTNLPNPHFEMKGRGQPPGKGYEMRQAPQPYV